MSIIYIIYLLEFVQASVTGVRQRKNNLKLQFKLDFMSSCKNRAILRMVSGVFFPSICTAEQDLRFQFVLDYM